VKTGVTGGEVDMLTGGGEGERSGMDATTELPVGADVTEEFPVVVDAVVRLVTAAITVETVEGACSFAGRKLGTGEVKALACGLIVFGLSGSPARVAARVAMIGGWWLTVGR
jgi:hypothetical protein